MRYFFNPAYGTQDYDESLARQLRALNIATWCAATAGLVYAVYLAILDFRTLWPLAGINLADAIIWSMIPLLHRFGYVAAPIGLALSVFLSSFLITGLLGTDSSVQLYFMSIAGVAVLFGGTTRIRLALLFVVLAASLHLLALWIFPDRTALSRAHPDVLIGTTATAVFLTYGVVSGILLYLSRARDEAEQALAREYQRSEGLLINILPPVIAERLKGGREKIIADTIPEASVLFIDIVGFTRRAAEIQPNELVIFLNRVFTRFDALVENFGMEKIKTIGDAYMAVAGVPEPRPDHASAAADLALAMRDAAAAMEDTEGNPLNIRIGIASGPLVAGVVGTHKFAYDVWGDTVNVAARMESHGEPGMIHLSDETRQALGKDYQATDRGEIEIKGKGKMRTWFLEGRKS